MTLQEQKRVLRGRGYELSWSFRYRCPDPELSPYRTESLAGVEWEQPWYITLYELRVGPLDKLPLLQPEDVDCFTDKRLDDLMRDQVPYILLLPDSAADADASDVVQLYVQQDLLPRGTHLKFP